MGRPGGFGRRAQGRPALAATLAYSAADAAMLDRYGRVRTLPPGTASKIRSLRLRQRLLKRELRETKRRLMIPDNRWTFERESKNKSKYIIA